MSKISEFIKNYYYIILGVVTSGVFSLGSLFYLSSKLEDNQSLLFWIGSFILIFLIVGGILLLLFLLNKKRKHLKTTDSGKIKTELKIIFKKLKKESKNFKKLPWILFNGCRESSGDELFSRSDFGMLQLNKKENNGFSVWYCPEFIALDIGSELFDITCASEEFSKNFKYLLKFFRNKRKYCPFNSYVISLPFNYFSHTNSKDLKENAQNLAKKFEHIQQKLRIRFPVYLLIDRIDLVHGFYDYIKNLKESEKKQIVGWSTLQKISEIPEEQNITNYFEEFSSVIFDVLYKEQTKLTLKTGTSGSASYCFAKTIKNVIPTLKDFINNIFTKAVWQFSPLHLRGVYFTAIKSDSKYGYISCIDTNSRLQYSKISLDKESRKFTKWKDNSLFFFEDLFRKKILKEDKLISYTSSFLIFMKIVRVSLLVIGLALISTFIYYSFTETSNFGTEILSETAKSWNTCANEDHWQDGRFSPFLLTDKSGNYCLNNPKINGEDSLTFILNFYTENSPRINIPDIYTMSDWIINLNKQKERAKNTILYTSIINPLLEALLQKYSFKIGKFDENSAEAFSNTFEYAKLLCDYDAHNESFFPYSLGTGVISGLNLYLEDAYRIIFPHPDKKTDDTLAMLTNVKVSLQELFNSHNVPYGVERSYKDLINSDFMANKEIYKENIFGLIGYCLQNYLLGPKSLRFQKGIKAHLINEFLSDAENCNKNESAFFQSLTMDQMIEKAENLKTLLNIIDNANINMSSDNELTVLGSPILVREQDRVRNGRALIFNDIDNTVKFNIDSDFRNSLFFELGIKKNLYKKYFLKEFLTNEQYYLFFPFYEMFKSKNNNFTQQYAVQIENLKDNLSYCLALKYLTTFLYTYDREPANEAVDNVFSLINNTEIKHNKNIDTVVRYLVEFSTVSKFFDIVSNYSFPFTLKEFMINGDLISMADTLSNTLDNLLPPDISSQDKSSGAVNFQNTINTAKNLPPIIGQWVAGARKIIAFIHDNKDFVSKVYLMNHDYSKDFIGADASNVWVGIKIEQDNSDYKSTAALTRINSNLFLDRISLTDTNPLKINFYRTIDSMAQDQPEETLYIGTLPLFKLMVDNPNPTPVFKDKYFITWDAAKFDTDSKLWISKIRFISSVNHNEMNMYIGFTMPNGADCLGNCLTKEDRTLMTKLGG